MYHELRKRGTRPMAMPDVPLTALQAPFEVPRHVAIIMDGNGRWAAARGLPRTEGHRRGVEALRRTVRAAGELGIGTLTIFSFSSENWSRPPAEVRDLMALLRRFIRNDLAELHGNNVRVRVIGERDGLAPDILRLLAEAEDLTRENEGLILVVAFNDPRRFGSMKLVSRAKIDDEPLLRALGPDARAMVDGASAERLLPDLRKRVGTRAEEARLVPPI